MRNLILLVEDNEQILHGNRRMLNRQGYDVMMASTLKEARTLMREEEPDAIVLDVMLPDGNGLDFMSELRKQSNVPILLLTGLGTSEDVVRGLSQGGDDYLTKPYEFSVFLARIDALLRRANNLPKTITKGALKLDVVSRQAYCNGKNLLLTQKDFALLLLFIQNENRVMSVEYLYEQVWKLPLSEDTQAIKSAISRLRKKLMNLGYTISAHRNEGYIFERE
ncbi:hypothetical protein A4S06_09175 [Erysipelotrichaceae bacterium MTC7]|nr:hypothetical protein A4S06_09175 [Erysipelotrichaceae bacterium MTC7]